MKPDNPVETTVLHKKLIFKKKKIVSSTPYHIWKSTLQTIDMVHTDLTDENNTTTILSRLRRSYAFRETICSGTRH